MPRESRVGVCRQETVAREVDLPSCDSFTVRGMFLESVKGVVVEGSPYGGIHMDGQYEIRVSKRLYQNPIVTSVAALTTARMEFVIGGRRGNTRCVSVRATRSGTRSGTATRLGVADSLRSIWRGIIDDNVKQSGGKMARIGHFATRNEPIHGEYAAVMIQDSLGNWCRRNRLTMMLESA